MAYIDNAYLYKLISADRIRALTGDDSRSADSDRITDAITEAHVKVESYLRGRYKLPLSPVPDIVKSIERDITVTYLYKMRPDVEMPQGQSAIYAKALQALEDIRDGKTILVEPTEVTDDPAPIIATKSESDRLFGASTLRRAFPWKVPRD